MVVAQPQVTVPPFSSFFTLLYLHAGLKSLTTWCLHLIPCFAEGELRWNNVTRIALER